MFSKLLSPDLSDAPRSGSGRHLYSDVGDSSSSFPVSATMGLPPVLWAATSHPTTEPQHLSLSTAAPATMGTVVLQTHVRPDLYLIVTRTSDARDSCNAVVRDERRRLDIGSHVKSTFQTAARGFRHLAPQSGSNLDHRRSWLCAFLRGRHSVSDGYVSTPLELFHRGDTFWLNTEVGGPISPSFCLSEAGVARPLYAHA